MILFYHIADLPHWQTLVDEKITMMKDVNLWNSFSNIYLLCHYNSENFKGWIKQFETDPRITSILYRDSVNPLGEIYSNRTIHTVCSSLSDNTPIFRYHTKGISQLHNHNRNASLQWNSYLDYYNIVKWDDCVKKLETHDAAGVNVHEPTHFSGNIYWANSNYIKTLPQFQKPHLNNFEKNITQSYSYRHDSELWIGLNNPKIYEFHHYKHANVYNVTPPQMILNNGAINYTTSD
jgi:hypothetical protein